MLFHSTALTAFRPEIQDILVVLDEAVRADIASAGKGIDEAIPFSHYARNQKFDTTLMLDEPFISLFRYENVEFIAAYLADFNQNGGWDDFMTFVDDTGNGFATELSLERSKGGLSGVLSRVTLQGEGVRFAALKALIEWHNSSHACLDENEVSPGIHMLHTGISTCFVTMDLANPIVMPCGSLTKDLFQRVVGVKDLAFDGAAYRKGLKELIDDQPLDLILNNLVPHLLYDPIMYMCEVGYATDDVISRIEPAFDILLEPLSPDANEKKALFEQMLFNALSLYPERLDELPIATDCRFELGDHPLLRAAGSLSPLTRILAGPLGAFASDLLMDVPDAERVRQLAAGGIVELQGVIDSHLVRTPAAGCLKVIQDVEDLVMLDYLLAKQRVASETIHYAWRSMAPAAQDLSTKAQMNLIAGELDFWIRRNRLNDSTLSPIVDMLKKLPHLLPEMSTHMLALLEQGVAEEVVSRCSQQLGLLNVELLRKPSIAKRQSFHEAILGQDLGL